MSDGVHFEEKDEVFLAYNEYHDRQCQTKYSKLNITSSLHRYSISALGIFSALALYSPPRLPKRPRFRVPPGRKDRRFACPFINATLPVIGHEQQHGLYAIRVDPSDNEGVFGQIAHFLSIDRVVSLGDDEDDDTVSIACDKGFIKRSLTSPP